VNNRTTGKQNLGEESEISINDIINFFLAYRKLLLIGALMGSLISIGITLRIGKYEAVATIVNNQGGLDYVSWSKLKKELPILAYHILQADKNEGSYLNELNSEKWWYTNVISTFSFSKDDNKEILSVTKELQDAESTKIMNFLVKAAGPTKEQALANLSEATAFIRSGAAYLALKDLVAGYQIQLLNTEPEIEKNILALLIELPYLNRRSANLELLNAKFPSSSNATNNQVVDLEDSSAKYLPVSTQLIAVNREISALKENLSRLKDKKEQLAVISVFLSQANSVIDKNFDGLAAIAEVAKIESSIRKNVKPTDLNTIQLLDGIKYSLALIRTKFTIGIDQPALVSTSPPKYLRNASFGLLSGFFLALMASLFPALRPRFSTTSANSV
jgi:hypothetical protein